MNRATLYMRILPLFVILLTACYPKSRLLNWHRTVEPDKDTAVINHVELFGFVFAADPLISKDVLSLAEDGQQAYIQELGKHVKTSEDLAAAMALPFRRKASPTMLDLSTFKKKMVFTITHEANGPADRIASLTIRLKMPDTANYQFLTWDKIVTQYSTVELGTVSLTGTNTFKLAPQVTMSGDILGATAGEFSKAAALTEAASLAKRFIDVNGSLSPYEARLNLNGMPGRDLAGNVVAEVTMKATTTMNYAIFNVSELFQTDGTANAQDKVDLGEVFVKVPTTNKEVLANASYDVCVRTVKRGSRTIAEGDDHVMLHCDTSRGAVADIKVVDGFEFDVKLYYLIERGTDRYLGLEEAGANSAIAPLAFRSIEEALALRRWLVRTGETDLQDRPLKWGSASGDSDYVTADVVKIFIDEQSLQPRVLAKSSTRK